MTQHAHDPKWSAQVERMFEDVDLPEVSEERLETGTYTNVQIAEKVGDLQALRGLLMSLPAGGSNAARRSMLSMAVDLLYSNNVTSDE